MTPTQKSALINDLIKENRDYTVRDYLKHLEDIESVERTAGRRSMHTVLSEVSGFGRPVKKLHNKI